VFFPRRAIPGVRQEVPWFEIAGEHAGTPGSTIVSLADWPVIWEHPERAKTMGAIAQLMARVDQLEVDDWTAVLESIELALHIHISPKAKFQKLAAQWREETALFSSSMEICTHPTYQQIIGMGPLALPFIFADLQVSPEHWFWALNAITGEDPITGSDRGDLQKMTDTWLRWAKQRQQKLTLGWLHAFAASEFCT
jgi:hypothetical protein